MHFILLNKTQNQKKPIYPNNDLLDTYMKEIDDIWKDIKDIKSKTVPVDPVIVKTESKSDFLYDIIIKHGEPN